MKRRVSGAQGYGARCWRDSPWMGEATRRGRVSRRFPYRVTSRDKTLSVARGADVESSLKYRILRHRVLYPRCIFEACSL